ncbi:hypothetical protein GCM10007981_04680 [Thermocladium modestius]|uniref:Uncharacterized protein n=1 Tax=Thermocladium modestius TaxID=62609 RepID=A0A830GUE1_9CREN|nr:hypothetical protein [Thermocladium modestius]GGP19747.1 hypothetical protein GCM10007981_04680 [Thermocladium modestius]
MVRALVIGAAVAVVVIAITAALLLHPASKPQINLMSINAPYVFLRPEGNGQYDLLYYGPHGDLHDLGTYNASSSVLNQAVNVINSFNQQNMGTIINGQQYIPLSYEVVIGNSSGVIQIPIQGNTILLDKVNPGYWTVLVSDQNDLTKLAYALDVGYKEAATVSGTSNLWYQQGVGTVLQETMNLQHYAQNPYFTGGYIVIMNNNTIIPWGVFDSTTQYSYGGYLKFLMQAGAPYYG